MRTAAEVGEVTLSICGDMTVFEFGDKLAFVFFAAVAEEFERIGFGDVGADNGLVLFCQFEETSWPRFWQKSSAGELVVTGSMS